MPGHIYNFVADNLASILTGLAIVATIIGLVAFGSAVAAAAGVAATIAGLSIAALKVIAGGAALISTATLCVKAVAGYDYNVLDWVAMIGNAIIAVGLFAFESVVAIASNFYIWIQNIFTSAESALSKAKLDELVVKFKHLINGHGEWAKFNVESAEEALELVKKIIENGKIIRVIDNGMGTMGQQSYQVYIDAGEVIGTKGETVIRLVIDVLGKIWSVFPDK